MGMRILVNEEGHHLWMKGVLRCLLPRLVVGRCYRQEWVGFLSERWVRDIIRITRLKDGTGSSKRTGRGRVWVMTGDVTKWIR